MMKTKKYKVLHSFVGASVADAPREMTFTAGETVELDDETAAAFVAKGLVEAQSKAPAEVAQKEKSE
jgi:hypothetical protein